MNTGIERLLRGLAAMLIALSVSVSIPLAIQTFQEKGGPWGFGIVGLQVLLPLSAYCLFGIAGLARKENVRRGIFIAAHAITLIIGIATFIVFPVYPVAFTLIPVFLATVAIIDRRHLKSLLLLMIILALTANILLLKWELEFGRTLPLLQLFQGSASSDP